MKEKDAPISVNGDITPITKQPIERVDPLRWSSMSLTQLHDQRYILARRQQMALQVGMVSAAQQIQRGLDTIDALIDKKGATEGLELL